MALFFLSTIPQSRKLVATQAWYQNRGHGKLDCLHTTIEVAPIICELHCDGDNTIRRHLAIIGIYTLCTSTMYVHVCIYILLQWRKIFLYGLHFLFHLHVVIQVLLLNCISASEKFRVSVEGTEAGGRQFTAHSTPTIQLSWMSVVY